MLPHRLVWSGSGFRAGGFTARRGQYSRAADIVQHPRQPNANFRPEAQSSAPDLVTRPTSHDAAQLPKR
jgi:hypothetical protein